MANTVKLLVYPVKDIESAKAFFGKYLGAEPYMASPYYVGYRNGEQEIGLDPNSGVGPIAYIDVEDIKKSLAELTSAGGTVVKEPQDVGGGLQIAQVKDADGNVVGMRQKA